MSFAVSSEAHHTPIESAIERVHEFRLEQVEHGSHFSVKTSAKENELTVLFATVKGHELNDADIARATDFISALTDRYCFRSQLMGSRSWLMKWKLTLEPA